MRVLPLLSALLLLAPVAAAQVPSQPCGPLQFGKVTPPSPLPPGGEGDVTVTITNTNPVTPLSVVVSAATSTAGWSVKTGDQSISSLAASTTQTVTFHVVASKDAKQDMALSFSATGQCTGPGGVSCPTSQAQCVTTANASGAVALQQGGGLSFPGLDNLDFPIEYLVAGVVLVALAIAIPLLVRKRKPGLAADCPEPLKMVRPGRGTSFPIDIRNPGAEPLTAQFEVGPVPEGWSAFMPLPEVQLAPKESRSLWLMVRSPAQATTGATADVEVRLRSAARPDASATVKVRAEVNPNAAEGPTKVG